MARRPSRPGGARRRPARRRDPNAAAAAVVAEVKEETIEMDATVVEPLPNAMFKVKLQTGQEVLRAVTDWLSLHPPVRWLGGVRIDPSTPNWRWDEARQDVRMA